MCSASPKHIRTRVGSGPFPTELFDDIGTRLAERGNEFGSTTGGPTLWLVRCVALRQAVQINSISGLCLTKLDVLDGLEEINICTGYEQSVVARGGRPLCAVSTTRRSRRSMSRCRLAGQHRGNS